MKAWPGSMTGESIFTCLFVIMFGAMAAGQAQQFAPSAGQGLIAAKKIFSVIDEESEIDATKLTGIDISASSMKGEIEFRNVWFRYPSRPETWILKGLNLKISNKETIGLVGESGSGKSTITQLLY